MSYISINYYFFQAIYELYQGEVDLIEDLNVVKKVNQKFYSILI